MKHLIAAIALLIFLAGCSPSAGQIEAAIQKTSVAAAEATAKAPSATPEKTYCDLNVCVKQVRAYLTSDNIFIVEYALVDQNGKVETGNAPKMTGKLLMAVYSSQDVYLFGADIPETTYKCYVGNDISWADDKLASVCSVAIPGNILAEKVKVGDKVRVEAPDFNHLKAEVTILNR